MYYCIYVCVFQGESEVYRVGDGDIGDAGLNVTVTAQTCSSDGACVYRDESTGFEAALSLRCGSASVDVGEYIVSNYVGGTQMVLLTPQTPNVVGEVLSCVVTSETFNAGPIKYTLSVDVLEGLPSIVEEEAAALKILYERCCAEEGSCEYWNAVNVQAAKVSAARVARQGVAAAPEADAGGVPPLAALAPEADAGGIPPLAALAPEADAGGVPPLAALAPEAGAENSTSPFTDFCSLGGNACTSDGHMQTFYLKSFGLQCQFSNVVAIMSNMTQVQRFVLADNKGLFGSSVFTVEEIARAGPGPSVTDVQLDNTLITASSRDSTGDPSLNMLCRLAQVCLDDTCTLMHTYKSHSQCLSYCRKACFHCPQKVRQLAEK